MLTGGREVKIPLCQYKPSFHVGNKLLIKYAEQIGWKNLLAEA